MVNEENVSKVGRSALRLVVLAGPNGAGKSTAADSILRGALQVDEFVNADVIARGLSGFLPDRSAMAAGRIMLARLNELAERQVSFAFESILASRTFAPWISRLVRRGYEFHLVFLWLPRAKVAVARVAERVRRGGHNAPEAIIRRRYHTVLRNFFDLYLPLAATWQVIDNSSGRTMVIAEGCGTHAERIRYPGIWASIEQSTRHGKR